MSFLGIEKENILSMSMAARSRKGEAQVQAVNGPKPPEGLGQAAHCDGGAVGARCHGPRLMCDVASHASSCFRATGDGDDGARSGGLVEEPSSGTQARRQWSIAARRRRSTSGPIRA